MGRGMRLGSQDTNFEAETIIQETYWRVLLGFPPKKGDRRKTGKFGCDVASGKFLDDNVNFKIRYGFSKLCQVG